MNKNIKNRIRLVVIGSVVVLCACFTWSLANNKEIPEQPYPEFVEAMEAGKIDEVNISFASENFQYTNIDGETFMVSNPRSDDFKLLLLTNDIDVIEISEGFFTLGNFISLVLPICSLLMLFAFYKRMYSTGNSKKMVDGKALSNVRLSDIAGCPSVKKEVGFMIKYLKNPKMFEGAGAKMPKGILLYGDPGTGKTLIAKAIAGEADVPFYSMTGSDFMELFVGVGAKRVRSLFKKARETAPCIIFIDEIDAIGTKRGLHNNGELDQTINALLSELDGFSASDGVLVIASTNRLSELDPALKRSGRFDKHIKVPLPMTKEDRKAILAVHSKDKKFDESVNFDEIAKLTIGFSGADLATLLNEAVLESLKGSKEMVDRKCIDTAFYNLILEGQSNEDDTGIVSADREHQIKTIAYHEAGHSLVAKLVSKHSVPRTTIIGVTTGVGGFTFSIPEKTGILDKNDLETKVMELYAGRAAELIAGFPSSTGASNDIEVATKILKEMYTAYGMDDKFLLNSNILYGDKVGICNGKNAAMEEKIIEESNRLFNKAHEFLNTNHRLLVKLVDVLIKEETIDEDTLCEVINDCANEKQIIKE